MEKGIERGFGVDRPGWDHALRICSRMTNFHSMLVLGGRSQVLRRFLF
jgi:hypothetical protein